MLNPQNDNQISQSQQQKELYQFFESDISQILPLQTADQNLTRIKQLQSEVQDTKQSLEMKSHQYQSLKKTNRILQYHLELQKSRIATLQQRISELQAEIRLLNNRKIIEETDKGQIQNKNQSERQLNEAILKYQHLKQQYQRLQNDNYGLKLSLEQKQKALGKKLQELKNVGEESTDQKEQIKKGQQQQRKLKRIIQQLQEKSKQSSKIAYRQKQVIDSLHSQKKNMQSALKQLQKQCLSYQRKEAESANKIRLLQQALKYQQDKQQNQKKIIQTLQDRLKKMESKLQTNNQSSKMMGQNLNLQQETNTPPTQEFNLLNQTYRSLQGSIDEYMRSYNTSRQQKVQFLNLLIFKAESELEKTHEEFSD